MTNFRILGGLLPLGDLAVSFPPDWGKLARSGLVVEFVGATISTGTPVVSLEVAVKKPVTLNTFIHFVFDKAGRTTPQGLTGALQTVEVANKIMQPQTNLTIVRGDSGGMRLPFEMPR